MGQQIQKLYQQGLDMPLFKNIEVWTSQTLPFLVNVKHRPKKRWQIRQNRLKTRCFQMSRIMAHHHQNLSTKTQLPLLSCCHVPNIGSHEKPHTPNWGRRGLQDYTKYMLTTAIPKPLPLPLINIADKPYSSLTCNCCHNQGPPSIRTVHPLGPYLPSRLSLYTYRDNTLLATTGSILQ